MRSPHLRETRTLTRILVHTHIKSERMREEKRLRDGKMRLRIKRKEKSSVRECQRKAKNGKKGKGRI